jgi:hypothetical protein
MRFVDLWGLYFWVGPTFIDDNYRYRSLIDR